MTNSSRCCSSKKLEVGAGTEARAKWGEGWVAESDKDEECIYR